MRHLGKVSFALVLLVACQGMYDGKSQRLRNPEPVPRPKNLPADDVVAARPPIEVCDYRWVATAAPIKKAPAARVEEQERIGDAKVQLFSRPTTKPDEKSNAIIDGIDAYGRALLDDPFNPVITLKLALAYDKVDRKGCALALLGRLAKMSDNPKFSAAANVTIDEIVGRKDYFERYRRDAIKAAGR